VNNVDTRKKGAVVPNSPRPLIRKPGHPLYVQLARKLINDIGSGTYSVDEFLPTESELCEIYCVSRYTVREALKQLIRTGLVTRRQGSGTVVRSLPSTALLNLKLGSVSELLQYAREMILEIESVSTVIADKHLATTLNCEEGQAWTMIEATRRDKNFGRVYCTTRIFFDIQFENLERKVREVTGPICLWLEEEYGARFERINQEISAVKLTNDQAATLKVSPGATALQTVRKFSDKNGKVFEISINIHPGDLFTYDILLEREDKV